MKRIIAVALALVLCLSVLSVTAFAASSATLTGPGTVRAGDTITLILNISGSGIIVADGVLSYDTTLLEMTGQKQLIGDPWVVDFEGNLLLIYDNNQKNPINGSKAVLSLTFKVKANVAAGTRITVSCNQFTTTDGIADTVVGTVSYSATVAPPLSRDNNLGSLTVSNAEISPAFNTDTLNYTANVPFSVEKLDIKATARDGKAKVSVKSPTLTPNATTNVTVTVTAENGSSKTYTIAVKREQDPNYVPSSNNSLSGIAVEGFLLSPVFDPAVTEYVIWLPYEVESVSVSGTAADALASVRVEGGEALTAGADNVIKVICTAENGTELVYTVVAKRAPAHDGSSSEPTEPTEPSEPATDPTEPENEPTDTPTEPATPAPSVDESDDGIALWVVILVGVLCLLLGAGGMYFLLPMLKKNGDKKSK